VKHHRAGRFHYFRAGSAEAKSNGFPSLLTKTPSVGAQFLPRPLGSLGSGFVVILMYFLGSTPEREKIYLSWPKATGIENTAKNAQVPDASFNTCLTQIIAKSYKMGTGGENFISSPPSLHLRFRFVVRSLMVRSMLGYFQGIVFRGFRFLGLWGLLRRDSVTGGKEVADIADGVPTEHEKRMKVF